MKKSKVLKWSLIIVGIIVVGIVIYFSMNLITNTVITANSGETEESSSENTEELVEDAENYKLVQSLDGYTVPVPTGYTASSIESEMYVNGTTETYKGTKEELTFSSSGDYAWTQNNNGVWVSGNEGVATTSTLTSQFEVGDQGGRLTVNWSVSCATGRTAYLYAEITNDKGETIRSSNINGTVYGTSESNLVYTTYEEDLDPGTYTLSIIYYKSSTTSTGLDSGYVESANVISYIEEGEEDEYEAEGIDIYTVTVHKYGGFVIYEGTEKVTDANAEVAQTTRNQWVWVPVDSKTVERIYSESTSGVKTGRYYTFSATTRTESGTGREPALLTTSRDNEYYFTRYGLSGMTRESFYQELQLEFENTIESIKKYGGFYIGRYETGDVTSAVPVVQKMNTSISSVTWYAMYSKMGYLAANTYVKTNMIWGCLWDETLQWFVESGSLKQDELVVSQSWGNYIDSSVTYEKSTGGETTTTIGSGTKIPAGSSEDTKVNNIYDMAGNVVEWTLEAYSTSSIYRSGRGGNCNNYGANYPASNRYYYNPYGSGSYLGFRAYLYIQ